MLHPARRVRIEFRAIAAADSVSEVAATAPMNSLRFINCCPFQVWLYQFNKCFATSNFLKSSVEGRAPLQFGYFRLNSSERPGRSRGNLGRNRCFLLQLLPQQFIEIFRLSSCAFATGDRRMVAHPSSEFGTI